ncbi:MAG: methionyl-tRNA formyltransferase [Myxococcota bacterium]|jgi:methionyl-tRNA formyltransferase
MPDLFQIGSWPPRLVFMGTPEFAVPALQAVAQKVCTPQMVVTQPDRPRGRGRGESLPPPVKVAAAALGVPVLQPEKVRDPVFISAVREARPDIILVVAYGRILPAELLAIPSIGCVNVHASLLLRYRGAAPINWAVVRGEAVTGVSIQRMVQALDAGDVLHSRQTEVGPDETAGELYARLMAMGAEAAVEFMELARAGLVARPQDEAMVSWAPVLEKADGELDWAKDAREIHNMVRGMNPWPGAWTRLDGSVLKVHRSRAGKGDSGAAPGTVLSAGPGSVLVASGNGTVELLELQGEGGRRMGAADFARGRRLAAGAILGGVK